MAEANGKVKRGVSLTEKTNADLEELCAHLGVNMHSYMVNELAKAIQRDRLALHINKNQQQAFAGMTEIFERLMQEGINNAK